jgi:CheY-like chemotaxis protein
MFDAVERLARVTSDIIWTVVTAWILIYLRAPLKKIAHRFAEAEQGELSLTKEGFALKYRGIIETAVGLGADAAATAKAKISEAQIRGIASTVAGGAQSGGIRQALRGKRVLWVDDKPENNTYGTRALEIQGAEVVAVGTTKEALENARLFGFDAIITDQSRVEDGAEKKEAGYDLMRALNELHSSVPVILSTAFPSESDAKSRGFYGATNTQYGVFDLVVRAVNTARR